MEYSGWALMRSRGGAKILLSIAVVVSGKRPNKATSSERSSTVVVNAHDALTHLREMVTPGPGLRIKNVLTRRFSTW